MNDLVMLWHKSSDKLGKVDNTMKKTSALMKNMSFAEDNRTRMTAVYTRKHCYNTDYSTANWYELKEGAYVCVLAGGSPPGKYPCRLNSRAIRAIRRLIQGDMDIASVGIANSIKCRFERCFGLRMLP